MYYSLSEIFAIGIGPSSSHTVGPMKAAKRFVDSIKNIKDISKVDIYLYMSAAFVRRRRIGVRLAPRGFFRAGKQSACGYSALYAFVVLGRKIFWWNFRLLFRQDTLPHADDTRQGNVRAGFGERTEQRGDIF